MSQRRSPSPLLEPPRRSLEDPGARELESSDNEDEHFSDASEGRLSQAAALSGRTSPIPITRVERIDDSPSYGEVPGTEAYKMRMQDAVPDQVEVTTRSRSASQVSASRATTGGPIPVTVVEKIDPVTPSHDEVPRTAAHHIRSADAEPDLVVQAPAVSGRSLDYHEKDSQTSGTSSTEHSKSQFDRFIPLKQAQQLDLDTSEQVPVGSGDSIDQDLAVGEKSHEAGDEGVGDDFDDFEEGDSDAEDFGDFGEGIPEADREGAVKAPQVFSSARFPSHSFPQFPLMDFEILQTPEDVISAADACLQAIYPQNSKETSPFPKEKPVFLTERSASLYAQLLAPPPLLPPNWIRSRIRRLFLVSLGVPIDLDEILPASKQKKLVLPSINLGLGKTDSQRPSSESRRIQDGLASREKQQLGSTGLAASSRRRRGPPPAPDLDAAYARMVCDTTAARLGSFSDDELAAHTKALEQLLPRATEVLEYWMARKDGALREKEAFEGVIENLVKHARRVRK